jgi:hypothetical protein
MKTKKQNFQNNSSRQKLYKPKYFPTLILVGLVLFFYIILRIIKEDFSPGEFLIYLIMYFIVILIELLGFARAVVFEKESMKLYNGFQYVLHLKSREIRYSEIIKINEMDTPRKKFANLKIITKSRIYMIFVAGIYNYEDMKKELKFRI